MPLQKLDEQNVEKDLRKNKPQVVFPILSSFISLVLIIVVTVVKGLSQDSFTWVEYLLIVGILILLPVAMWFGSYFVKKQKTEMLQDYTKETEDILEFIKNKKDFYVINAENKEVKINYEKINELEYTYSYDKEKSIFEPFDKTYAYISLGIGFTTLKIDPNNLTIVGLSGMLPKSIMLKKKLKFNKELSFKGKLSLETNIKVMNKTFIDYHTHDDIYYDVNQNLVCVGEPKIYDFDDIIEFLPNAYLVLRDNIITGLWIYIN